MKHAKYQILNTFGLKIIAIIVMSLDHAGQFLLHYGNLSFSDKNFWNNPLCATGYVLCCVGRLALPIFCVLFAEGMRHSHDREKYVARLGLMAAIIFASEIIIRYTLQIAFDNIFLLFVCAGTFILLFERKDNYKYLMFLPLAVVIMGFSANLYTSLTGGELLWWPAYLRPQYNLYGFLLMVLSYFAYRLADQRVLTYAKDNHSTLPLSELQKSAYYRTLTNILWAIILVVVTVFFWLLSIINYQFDVYTMNIQSYALITVIPLLLYNGEKGYKHRAIQYGFYLYYPIHLGLLLLGFFLGFGYLPGANL